MKFEFEGEMYVVEYGHNTLDNFLRNLHISYGSSKMGVHTATGKDLQQSKYKKCLKAAFKPLMKHFKYELGTTCMIKKWESPEEKANTPTFAQEDPLAQVKTKLSKKDIYFKKKGRSEALDKALAVIFPEETDSETQELLPEIKRKRRAFKKAVMAACARKNEKKAAEQSAAAATTES